MEMSMYHCSYIKVRVDIKVRVKYIFFIPIIKLYLLVFTKLPQKKVFTKLTCK